MPSPYIRPRLGPESRRERSLKREQREYFRTIRRKLPRLQQIVKVELDKIYVPPWAIAKAIKGLTITDSAVWLKRIAATALARMDEEAGGRPLLSFTAYRRCLICDRPLLGAEAEMRWELDCRYEGNRIPCGPDCVEVEKLKKAS